MDRIQSHNSELITLINSLSAPITPIDTGIKEKVKRDKNIRAVIFDVYGTMFVSGSGDIGIAKQTSNSRAAASALESEGLIEKNLDSNIKEAIGNHTLEFLHTEIEKSHMEKREGGIDYPEVDIVEIWERVVEKLRELKIPGIKYDKIEEYDHLASTIGDTGKRKLLERIVIQYEFRVNHTWPMPGLEETLNNLIKGAKLKLGIISNAQFFTPLMIEAFTKRPIEGLGFDSRLILWSYIEGIAKPSRVLFNKMSNRLTKIYGILPSETLYVGNDMLNDILPAKALNFKTCLFAGDTRSLRLREEREECRGLKPDFVITELKSLLNITCQIP